ncbi:MAG TPA: methylmalonyl-CoA epimerase [Propionibacteriaceae bacterium]|nr:methylmalonyl-CoA epimerase [Propionibacteriaceae bacterium]
MTPELDAIPGLLGIDHIGVAVPEIEAAIAFHTVLGLRLEHREDNPEQGVREAMLVAGDPASGLTRLQLIAPLTAPGPGPASSVARFLTRRGPGLHHLAYRVADLRAASAVLPRRGYRLLYDAPRGGTRGSLINFIDPKDAGGVLIELVEPAATDQHSG